MTIRLPSWDECAEAATVASLNAIQQFVYNHEPAGNDAEPWREQLIELLEYVVAPRTKRAGDDAAPRMTKRAMARDAIADQRPEWTAAQAPSLSAGKVWKGTGKFFMKDDVRTELGSWSNPAGDIEAQRLTKESGIIHLVDPRTGDVISMSGEVAGHLSTAEMAAASGSPEHIGGTATEVGVKPV